MEPEVMLKEDGGTLHVVHLALPTGKVACAPGRAEEDLCASPGGVPWHRSDDPRAVTCRGCKGSLVFKHLLEEITAAVASGVAVR